MRADISYVWRSLVHARWFTLGALLTFALGIGVNTAVFILVDRVLFRPLPFSASERLVTVHSVDPKTGQVFFMLPRAVALEARRSAPAFEDLAYAGNSRSFSFEGADAPPLRLTESSFNLLDVLGVTPVAGRNFTREDAQSGVRLLMLREEIWVSRYGRGDTIFQRTFRDRTGATQVIGILPNGFINPSVNWATPTDGLILASDVLEGAGLSGMPGLVARLKEGASVEQAQTQFESLLQSAGESDKRLFGARIAVQPIQEGIFWNCRIPLSILFGAGLLVWLVACANLGTLMSARASSLEHQSAIRVSLGATRYRILSLTLIEAALLCLLGGILSLVALVWTIGGLAKFVPAFIQPLALSDVDGRVAVFVMAGIVVGCFLATLYPLARSWRYDQHRVFNRSDVIASSHRKGGSLLIALQSAVGTVLVVAGGLSVYSFVGLNSADLGFTPGGLYTVTARFRTPEDEQARVAQYEQIIEALRTVPGVSDVSAVDVALGAADTPQSIADPQGNRFVVRQVFPGYFGVVGTPILAGRTFTDGEVRSAAMVVIMSASAVRQVWPNLEPTRMIGSLVPFMDRQLIGVVGDTRARHALPSRHEMFLPARFSRGELPTFVIRSAASTRLDSQLVRDRLQPFGGPQLTVSSVDAYMQRWLEDPKTYAKLFGTFAFVGLLLLMVGLFALITFHVSLRQREIGVRLALGASPREIQTMLIGYAVRPVLLGCLAGACIGYWYAASFQPLLHNVNARGWYAYGAVIGVMAITAVIAAWRPARVAAARDPLTALRTE